MTTKAALPKHIVEDFVNSSHGNIERVRSLLDLHPTLLNAAWDWGAGDWETALGAAAHMGRRDIAILLLERGARMDIFAAAMLGHLQVVQALISVNSDAWQWRGPHGIPLLKHAEAGGTEAEAVVRYLSTRKAEANQ